MVFYLSNRKTNRNNDIGRENELIYTQGFKLVEQVTVLAQGANCGMCAMPYIPTDTRYANTYSNNFKRMCKLIINFQDSYTYFLRYGQVLKHLLKQISLIRGI